MNVQSRQISHLPWALKGLMSNDRALATSLDKEAAFFEEIRAYNFDGLRVPSLHENKESTARSSQTKLDSLNDWPAKGHSVTEIKVCSNMLDNLQIYAGARPRRATRNGPQTTFDVKSPIESAPVKQQLRASRALFKTVEAIGSKGEMMYSLGTGEAVLSEGCIRDFFAKRLLEPMNDNLMTRYANPMDPKSLSGQSAKLSAPRSSAGASPGFFPVWRTSKIKKGAKTSDYDLYRRPDERVAVLELKTFWSYKTIDVLDMWDPAEMLDNQGHFKWGTNRTHLKAVMQTFAELTYIRKVQGQGTRIGMFSNADIAVVFVLGADPQKPLELRMSKPIKISEDPKAFLSIFSGISMAALDSYERGTPAEEQVIWDIVCPARECEPLATWATRNPIQGLKDTFDS